MKAIISLVFTVLALFAFSAGANQVVDECERSLLSEPLQAEFHEGSHRQTVKIIGYFEGAHGGKRLLLERTGKKWLSDFANFKFDLQGDPRWFVGAVGQETAEFFGFKILNQNYMQIPDPVEFQGALDKTNEQLVKMGLEPAAIRIVADDLQERPVSGYLDHFQKMQLPFATSGMHLVHDMSFHSGVILMPNKFTEIGAKRTKFIRDFVDFIVSRTQEENRSVGIGSWVKTKVASILGSVSSLAKSHESRFKGDVARFKKYINFFLVRSIDNGTAYGNLAMIARQTQDTEIHAQIDSLVSEMSDSSGANTDSYPLAIRPGLYLTFGRFDLTKHLKNRSYSISSRRISEDKVEVGYPTLRHAAIDMLKQMYESLVIEKLETDHYMMPGVYLEAFGVFINSQMEAFMQTEEGKEADLNLLQIVLPAMENPTTYMSQMVENEETAGSAQLAFDRRTNEIKSAVQALKSR